MLGGYIPLAAGRSNKGVDSKIACELVYPGTKTYVLIARAFRRSFEAQGFLPPVPEL